MATDTVVLPTSDAVPVVNTMAVVGQLTAAWSDEKDIRNAEIQQGNITLAVGRRWIRRPCTGCHARGRARVSLRVCDTRTATNRVAVGAGGGHSTHGHTRQRRGALCVDQRCCRTADGCEHVS